MTTIIRHSQRVTCVCMVVGLCAPQPVSAEDQAKDVLREAADRMVDYGLRDSAEKAVHAAAFEEEESEWTVDALVGAAELVYATLKPGEADTNNRIKWIERTLQPIVSFGVMGLLPKKDRRKEAYRRAVVMNAILRADRSEEFIEFGMEHDPKNAIYTLLGARNAFRAYDLPRVRKLIRTYRDDPQPAHVYQRYSLARMSMALRKIDRLDDDAERALILLQEPPMDSGLSVEITSILAMGQNARALLIERKPSEVPDWVAQHTTGQYLAYLMQEQPPKWRANTSYILLRLMTHNQSGFSRFGQTSDMGKPWTERQVAWAQRLETVAEEQLHQTDEDEEPYRALFEAGKSAERKKYIADPIAYMESRHPEDRRAAMTDKWLALWREWSELTEVERAP